MKKNYLQIDSGTVSSQAYCEWKNPPSNIIEAPDGSDYLGFSYVDGELIAPIVIERLPVWSDVEFLMVVGPDVVEFIETSPVKEHRFFNRLIAKADTVDMNDPRYFEMLEGFFETDHPAIWETLKGG